MSEFNIQRAIFDRLSSDTVLAGLLTAPGVYDFVPQAAKSESDDVFPFLTIGDDTHSAYDTDEVRGFESSINVHQWSRHKGRLEAKEIQGAVFDSLEDFKLQIEGMNTVLLQWESSTVVPEPDPDTQHGVMTFRLLAHRDIV